MNKKAQSAAMWIVIVLIVGILGTSMFSLVSDSRKQTALQEDQANKEAVQTPEQASAASNVGDAAVVKVTAQDREQNDATTQVAVPAWFYFANKADNSFKGWLGQGAATTLSATAATTISPSVGDYICGKAFNGTGGSMGYYGDQVCEEITKVSGQTIVLPTHRTCDSTQLQGVILDNRDNTNSNISVGASSTNSFKQIEVRVNGTNCAYNLGGFAVDLNSNTNIDKVELGSNAVYGTLGLYDKTITRIKTKSEFAFTLETPKMLHENEYFYAGSLAVTADADGCTTPEAVNVTTFDVGQFKSSKGTGIMTGIEDDQQSPVDVGAPDVSIISSGKGASVTNLQNGDSTSFYCV